MPVISAPRWNQPVSRPKKTAGSVCRTIMPPIGWKSVENCWGRASRTPAAPNFTNSDTHWLTRCSSLAEARGRM